MKARRKQKKRLQESWKSIESWTFLKSNVYKCFAASFSLPFFHIYFFFKLSMQITLNMFNWSRRRGSASQSHSPRLLSIWYLLCLMPFSLCSAHNNNNNNNNRMYNSKRKTKNLLSSGTRQNFLLLLLSSFFFGHTEIC